MYPRRTVRSFVRREGRLTNAQRHALETLWPQYGIPNIPTWRTRFGASSGTPKVLDIGFGNGEALAQVALTHPQIQFIGVEVYRPGIGNLLRLLSAREINNVAIIADDAVTLLNDWFEPSSLQGCTIWFPDPWPKVRHHKRRLLNESFVELLRSRLSNDGLLHVATDWPDYADWIEALMITQLDFQSIAASQHELQIVRPQTKFERRGLRQGNPARDFTYRLRKS